MMRKKITVFLSRLCVVAMPFLFVGAVAQDKPVTTAQGKPFVEIQSQIVEITETIDDMKPYLDSIVARVENLEARVTANDDAITNLVAQNLIYDQQIADLLALASQNSESIVSALTRITSLEAELALLKIDITANAAAILTLQTEIAALADFVAANTEGLGELQIKVNNNLAAIHAMQEEIALIEADVARKQDILDGNCPAGSALTAIDPAGGITCAVSGSGGLGVTQFTVTKIATVGPRYWESHSIFFGGSHFHDGYGTAMASCPLGSVLTGGGVVNPHSLTVTANGTASAGSPANSWFVSARSGRSYPTTITAKAICLKFE